MGNPILPPELRKEVRALFPAWAGCAFSICAGAVIGDVRAFSLAVFVYGVGSLLLGAQSIGHEYIHRTLGTLLSQPAQRQRILLTKLAVLTPMLVILAVVALTVLFRVQQYQWPWQQTAMALLPALGGLSVAPWLTMVCRNPLAGTVLTASIAGFTLTALQLIGAAYRVPATEVTSTPFVVWLISMVGFSAVAVPLTWRKFLHLEAIEGTDRQIHLPRWLAGAKTGRTAHPLWLLAKKEIHLQYMALVVAGLSVVGWTSVGLVWNRVTLTQAFPLVPVTVMYLMLLSVLIGALASAEERQFGTLDSQLLLPMAAWQQWLVKAGTALGLAVFLGTVLPVVLSAVVPSEDPLAVMRASRGMTVAVVLMTAGSLYLSSLSTSGVKAMVMALPAGFGIALYIQFVGWAQWRLGRLLHVDLRPPPILRRITATDGFWMIGAAAVALLLLRFAFVNHRSAQHDIVRVGWQIVWIAAILTVAVAIG